MSRRSLAALMALLPATAVELTRAPLPALAAADGGELVFFDVKIEGQPAGRLVVKLLTDAAPAGARRFKELAQDRGGVGYRLSKFIGIYPTHLKNAGVASLSYTADAASPITDGESLEAVEAELSRQTRVHDAAGLVSLVVREAEERATKERLVAMNGKLVTVTEQTGGEGPNGTAWCLTRGPAPELDETNLIVGEVVSGMDGVVATIEALPINQPQYGNPYFQAGKAMGDKRAVVAEKAFYRPFKRVVVSACGLVQGSA